MTVHAAPYASPIEECQDAGQIRPLAHAEARYLAAAVLARFLTLLESLAPEEWNAPTYCSGWSVRDVVAHQAGAYASGVSYARFLGQWIRLPERGRSILDTVNGLQIRQRQKQSTSALIAELREMGPRAIEARSKIGPLLRSIPIPIPPLGLRPTGYLTDELYIRDTWIHTIDVCHATGRRMSLAAEPDRRIVELIVRDLAQRLPGALAGATVALDLTGPAGGQYRIGPSAAPGATLRMDTVEFNVRASSRISAQEAMARTQVIGDVELAARALQHASVVY